jgi:hypothetical protein
MSDNPPSSNVQPPMGNGHEEHHHGANSSGSSSFWRSKTAIGVGVFLVIGAFLLTSEHRAHVFGFLPYLLLLACPLLHVFMHGRHGKHGGHQSETKPPKGGTER